MPNPCPRSIGLLREVIERCGLTHHNGRLVSLVVRADRNLLQGDPLVA